MENQEKSWNTLKEGDFPSANERNDSLKKSVAEIKTLVDERRSLSSEVLRDAEKIKMEINNFVSENKQVMDKEGIREIIMLKQKQVEVSELQMKEKVSCWQDIARLKEELRAQEKELGEKESRLKMLDKILDS